MITIEIPTLPPSTNHAYYFGGKGKTFMTKAGKEFKELVRLISISKMNNNHMLEGRLRIRFDLYFKNKRKSDVDNRIKICLDSLQKIVFENDSQIDELTIVRKYGEPEKTIIEVEEI